MANPSLQIGNSNWAIKKDNLLGYSTAGTRFLPIPITMTRASAGTRVNPQGLVETVELLGSEEIQDGNFSSTVDWNEQDASNTIAGNQAIWTSSPHGQGFKGANANDNIFTLTKTYKVTYTIDYITSGKLRTRYPFIGATYDTTGTYPLTVTETGEAINIDIFIQNLDDGVNPTTAAISNISVKEVTKNDLARVDYTDGTSSLLAEPLRTNLVPYSEDFSQSSWTKQSGIVPAYNTTETLSPDGTYNATKFIGNGMSGIYKSSLSVSGVVSRSVYLKSVSGTTTATLRDPNATGGATPVNLTITNDWQRYELIGDNGTASQGLWIDDITSGGLYMWGAQLEAGSYATSYIPTSGEAGGVTRVQDQYSKTGISDLINSEEGVLFLEIAALADDGTDRRITLSDGSVSDQVVIGLSRFTSNINAEIHSGGVLQTSGWGGTGVTQTNNNKFAISWGSGTMKFYINGSPISLQTGVTSPIGLNSLKFSIGNDTLNMFAKVKQLQVFKTALTPSELATLTTI
jgi:hypothetical protein